MLPSAGRLAGFTLGIAAITIVALATLALLELDREVELNREIIAGLQVKDSLEALREELAALGHAAQLATLRVGSASQDVERRAVEIGAELDYLAQNPQREDRPAFEDLTRAAQLLVVVARSVATNPEIRAAPDVEDASRQAMAAVQRMLESQGAGINERMLAQIRVGETLHGYVSWLLAGSAVVLVGLVVFYLRAKRAERSAAERIERLAHYDVLTGLPNRSLLADRLDREVERARRTARGFALLMFDLDGFKAVNDTWGHEAGDELLAMVGIRAAECVRSADTVGRLGGDEFLAILPEASHDGARLVAEKLREAISRPYMLRAATATIGVSVGISYFGEQGDTAAALQRAADVALYEAKRRGKNRVLEAA
jgi:diguanylate cyclase (GGDEF)-like protein